jgi:hypothetical protein
MKTKAFYLFALSVLSLGCWRSAGFLLSRLGPDWLIALAIAAWLFISALALAAARVRYSGWIYAGLLVLAMSSLPLISLLFGIFADRPSPPWGYTASLMAHPVALLIALLLYSGLTSQARRNIGALEGDVPRAERQQAERAAFILVLSALALLFWEYVDSILGGMCLRINLFSWLFVNNFFSWVFVINLFSWLFVVPVVFLFVSALALAARRVSHRVWILAALLLLPGLSLPASVIANIFTVTEPPFALTLMPSVALLITALLLYSGLNAYREWQQASAVEAGRSQAQRKRAGRAAAVVFVVSAVLLAKTLHHLYWFTVWDNTYDSIGYLLLLVPVPAALLSGVTLSITLSGRMKWTGFLYSLLILGLMIAVSARAQRVDFRQLTEERAERVTQAIETYHAREGRYPQDLRQLVPRYVLSLPGPVIIYGQDWCYDGGEDYYRLGYLDREHWSDPRLFGRVYSAKGHSPLKVDICQPAIDTYRAQHPDWDRVLQDYGRPTPTPDIGE